jgi:phosphoribosylformimino-5-aminoimidazole carboxamide ribotide isomerase
MLIPSIDLQGGRIVQLVQGERLAVESADVEGWIHRFTGYPRVQVIDLDAAKDEGNNEALVARACAALPCRVGGGIRSGARARRVLALGARHVIVGSALFRDHAVDVAFARQLSEAIGADRIIAAVDSREGHVVIHGWRTHLPITAAEAIRQLEPFVSEFLYTHVDREGLMQGTDMRAIEAVRTATSRRVTAAGGITTMEEVEHLHSIGVDAVVGMALYTGRMELPAPQTRRAGADEPASTPHRETD